MNYELYNTLMVILGIDPGIGRVGWGIIRDDSGKHQIITYGCFETSSKMEETERLSQINTFISDLVHQYQPDAIAIEQLFFAANVRTAMSVGQARGVIVMAASTTGVPLTSYTPLQVKQAISGYGKADKKQIQMMVKTLLKLPTIPQPDDAADALAIALTHAFSYKLKKLIS